MAAQPLRSRRSQRHRDPKGNAVKLDTKMVTGACVALAGAAAILSPAGARAQADPRETAIGAATSFSIGYGIWLLEQRCMALPAEKHKAFEATIAEDMRRLREAVDSRLFNAAVGSGEDLAKDPKYADCKALTADGMGDFGITQAQDAATKLATLPPGYRLTITN
jgi:hypothetical protein